LAAPTTACVRRASSAVSLTALVIMSRVAAVSCRLAACSSVRVERSAAARLISPVSLRIDWVLPAITAMASARRSMAALKSSLSLRYSGAKLASIR
jgi:hypothetical protein